MCCHPFFQAVQSIIVDTECIQARYCTKRMATRKRCPRLGQGRSPLCCSSKVIVRYVALVCLARKAAGVVAVPRQLEFILQGLPICSDTEQAASDPLCPQMGATLVCPLCFLQAMVSPNGQILEICHNRDAGMTKQALSKPLSWCLHLGFHSCAGSPWG